MVKKQCKSGWKTMKSGIKSVKADLEDKLKGKVLEQNRCDCQKSSAIVHCCGERLFIWKPSSSAYVRTEVLCSNPHWTHAFVRRNS